MKVTFNSPNNTRGGQGVQIGSHNLTGKGKRAAGWVFVLVGIVAIGVGAYIFLSPGVPEEHTGSTVATITNIERYNQVVNGKTETKHNVFIEYTVDGKKYENQLNTYTSSMRQGGAVNINYDKRDPGVVFTPGAKTIAAAIVGGLGIIFFIVGIVTSRRPKAEAPTDQPQPQS